MNSSPIIRFLLLHHLLKSVFKQENKRIPVQFSIHPKKNPLYSQQRTTSKLFV